MFCAPRQDLRTNSYRMMSITDAELKGDSTHVDKTLSQSSGTSFSSYWFYKMDYILWENRSVLNKEDRWKDYRMTAKNSVEHISPQHPLKYDDDIVYELDDTEEVKRSKQDDFGNLVLLTSSMNSEYSNKLYSVKRLEYHKKKRLDSLKSDMIFANDQWNYELCAKHKEQMIKLFKEYILNT